jgi:hypothetical protein
MAKSMGLSLQGSLEDVGFLDGPSSGSGGLPLREERLSPRKEKEILAREQQTIQEYEERKAWRSERLKTVTNRWVDNRTRKSSIVNDEEEPRRWSVDRLWCCCMG